MRQLHYSQKSEIFNSGVIFLLLVLVTSLVLFNQIYEAKHQPLSQKNEAANQSKLTDQPAGTQSVALKTDNLADFDTALIPKILIFDKDSRQIQQRDFDKNEQTTLVTLNDQNIVDMAYNARSNQAAYIVAGDEVDQLKYQNLSNKQTRDIFSEKHSQPVGSEDEIQNSRLAGIAEISPNGTYITVQSQGLDWCKDKIIKVSDRTQIASDWCNSLRWFREGTRIMATTGETIGSMPGLALSPKGSISAPGAVALANVTGDVDRLNFKQVDDESLLAEDILAGDFVDANQVVILSVATKDNGTRDYKIFIYNDSQKKLKYVTGFSFDQPLDAQLRYFPKSKEILIAGTSQLENGKNKLLQINLDTAETKDLTFRELEQGKIRIGDLNERLALISVTDKQTSTSGSAKNSLYAIDLQQAAIKEIYQNQNWLYLGKK